MALDVSCNSFLSRKFCVDGNAILSTYIVAACKQEIFTQCCSARIRLCELTGCPSCVCEEGQQPVKRIAFDADDRFWGEKIDPVWKANEGGASFLSGERDVVARALVDGTGWSERRGLNDTSSSLRAEV